MAHPHTPKRPKLLLIDSRDDPGLAAAFRPRFEQSGLQVTLSSDDADTETSILPLLATQPFDLVLFFCSEAYTPEDGRWQVIPFDWSILGWKKQSINAATPLVAVVTAPDAETLSRFREVGVTQLIARGEKSSAQHVVEVTLRQFEVSERSGGR